MRLKRPMVVEAYMTPARTPLITERLSDGRIRKVARWQLVGIENGWQLELKQIRATHGDRWTGVRTVSLKTDQTDSMVLRHLNTPTAIIDLPVSRGKARNSLKRLLAPGRVVRMWDGNSRFGRYLYVLASQAHNYPPTYNWSRA